MGLDYSQKRLLSLAHRAKSRATISPMKRRPEGKRFAQNLEIYAFWTGFMSTIISLIQVIIIASKR